MAEFNTPACRIITSFAAEDFAFNLYEHRLPVLNTLPTSLRSRGKEGALVDAELGIMIDSLLAIASHLAGYSADFLHQHWHVHECSALLGLIALET